MGTNAYVIFLVLGVLLVVIDGQLIYRGGRRYMESSAADSGDSMVTLVTVLFHLAALGVVALLSVVDLGADTAVTAIMSRLGIVLLLLAVAHGVAMGVISHVRDEELAQPLHAREAANEQPVVNPSSDPRRDDHSRPEHRMPPQT